MTKEPINETDGIHEQWMPVAQEMTMEGLPEFLRHLTEDYHHDYGTICHAIADFMDNYKVDIEEGMFLIIAGLALVLGS